jgi:hypothetical protein
LRNISQSKEFLKDSNEISIGILQPNKRSWPRVSSTFGKNYKIADDIQKTNEISEIF